jgi:parvulin-like peptidyl-prolyl isomerase
MRSSRPLLLLVVVAVASVFVAHAQSPPAAPSQRREPPVATVGDRRVERLEFERLADQAVKQFAGRTTGRTDDEVKDLVRRQVLESQIRLLLLMLEARRQGISVSPLEAEAQLKQEPFFNPGGRYDESRFQAVKQQQPAQFSAVINGIREQLAARKLSERIDAERRPVDADVRARVRRQLVRADLEQWPIQLVDIGGTYPEPREHEVLDYYRTHPDEFRRPDRAVLSVAFVNVPTPGDSERTQPGFMADWDRRMRRLADSLMTAIRGGASFDDAARLLGGARPNVQVLPDNFPGYWAAPAAVSASVFKAAAGSVLPEPVAAREGYLLVRVDQVKPAHVAPLREVARGIRTRLRAHARDHREENEARAVYAMLHDSLRGTGHRVRIAYTDTSRLDVGEPSAADLERYYRLRIADYSSFDAARGQIVSKPLAEVRDDVRSRWIRDRRVELSRAAADQVLRAWQAGRRDSKLESRMTVRELPPALQGALLDTSAVGRAVSAGVWTPGGIQPSGFTVWARGLAVWQVTGQVQNVTPSFEQLESLLGEEARRIRDLRDEAGARALWESEPGRFRRGDVMHYSYAMVPPPDILEVKLTYREVENFWRENIERYSAPELVRARHVLVSPSEPTAEADEAARREAGDLLARLERGESFAALVREATDDAATRDNGGDLGVFGRGTMLEPFERAVFAMRPGDRSGLVKTEAGYHIIECTEHEPAVVHPLKLVYSNVGTEAATEKAGRLAQARTDSLLRTVTDARGARAAAEKLGLEIGHEEQPMDERPEGQVADYIEGLLKLRPGQIDRRVWQLKNRESWLVWVDSIAPPAAPTWEQVRERAIAEYRGEAGLRAMRAKRAELDSMLAAGWTVDSLSALWGGFIEAKGVAPGQGLPRMGGVAQVDSLVFGGNRAAALAPGETSGWLELPSGLVRVRLVALKEPPRSDFEREVERTRREDVERSMVEYFAGLQQRWQVRILDTRLRQTAVPGPPPRR